MVSEDTLNADCKRMRLFNKVAVNNSKKCIENKIIPRVANHTLVI